MKAEGIGFKHRSNRDGSFDSICLRCFSTVAREYTERALLAEESTHVCEERHVRGYDWTAAEMAHLNGPSI